MGLNGGGGEGEGGVRGQDCGLYIGYLTQEFKMFFIFIFNQKNTSLRLLHSFIEVTFQVTWPRQAAVAYSHT